MSSSKRLAVICLLACRFSPAADVKPLDAAAAFGALPTVSDVSLSPDGKSVAFITPTTGQGAGLAVFDIGSEARPQAALRVDGKPDRLQRCHWVSNQRLVCQIYGVTDSRAGIHDFTRLVAVNRDGSNARELTAEPGPFSGYILWAGGSIIDWLPEEDGAVLMTRWTPHRGSASGWTVDWLDTGTLNSHNVEPVEPYTLRYLSDGRGAVRIAERATTPSNGKPSDIRNYFYRKSDSKQWLPLCTANPFEESGFFPVAIDHDANLVYGMKRNQGRFALYSLTLDNSPEESLVYANDQVDVGDLIRLGRRNRVVGATYVSDYRHAVYLDSDIELIISSLHKALPQRPQIEIVDSSIDEQVLLVFASSDDDPGGYYVFDRPQHALHALMDARDHLQGVKLAKVTPVDYPASDGTRIPGYLTLPPGVEKANNLRAIVLPHGGPWARDEWGFNWLAQYFAGQGYAVMQPNFRGSAGYGEVWLQDNAFKSWRAAIGDVIDAGHWLVAKGIADPAKLGIVGWSYGGYAALQSAVVEPGFFKAVVAIAPVANLELLTNERHSMRRVIGEGLLVKEGSPAQNADKIQVPVLLFHGTYDRNVFLNQSESMMSHLKKFHVKQELVTWDHLDHALADPTARATMLRKSDEFLRQAMDAAK